MFSLASEHAAVAVPQAVSSDAPPAPETSIAKSQMPNSPSVSSVSSSAAGGASSSIENPPAMSQNVTKCDSFPVPAPVSAVTDPIAEACARVTNGELQDRGCHNSGNRRDLADVTSPEVLASIECQPEKLSPRQAQAMDLLLAGVSISETASRVGVSRQTVYRWRYNHPRFMSIYGRLTTEMSEQAGRRAEQLVYQALDIVQKALSVKNPNPTQLNAAIRVLSALRVSRLAFTPATPPSYQQNFDNLLRQVYRDETGKDPKDLDQFDRGGFAMKLADDNETETPGGQPVLQRIPVEPLHTQTTPDPDWIPPQPPLPVYAPARIDQQALLDALRARANPEEFAITHPNQPLPTDADIETLKARILPRTSPPKPEVPASPLPESPISNSPSPIPAPESPA